MPTALQLAALGPLVTATAAATCAVVSHDGSHTDGHAASQGAAAAAATGRLQALEPTLLARVCAVEASWYEAVDANTGDGAAAAHASAHGEGSVAQASVSPHDASSRLLPLYVAHLSGCLDALLGATAAAGACGRPERPALASLPGGGGATSEGGLSQGGLSPGSASQGAASLGPAKRRDPDAQTVLSEWRDCCSRWRCLLDQSTRVRDAAERALHRLLSGCSAAQRMRVRYLAQLAPGDLGFLLAATAGVSGCTR